MQATYKHWDDRFIHEGKAMPDDTLPALAPENTKELMLAAVAKGPEGVEALERLCALYERAQDKAAARAYHEAMTKFSGSISPIRKTATANIATKTGANFSYSYAPLDEIARTISGPLKDCGLSYTWDSVVKDGNIAITCTVRHVDGHTQTATFTCPVETSAGMSAQQKVAAALTFGRRQSLVQALGLSSCDPDNDGADTSEGTGEPISDSQAADLDRLIAEVGLSDGQVVKMLTWLKVDSIQAIRQSDYQKTVRAVESKREG